MSTRNQILTLSLVFIFAACNLGTPSESTNMVETPSLPQPLPSLTQPQPSPSASTIDITQVKAAMVETPLPTNLAEAEELILTRLRDRVRGSFGAEAEDLFNRVDAVEKEVASQAMKDLPEPPGSQPAPLFSSARPASFQGRYAQISFPASPFLRPQAQEMLGGILVPLISVVTYSNAPQNEPVETTHSTKMPGGQAEIKIKYSRQGSIMRADVEAEATVSQNGLAEKETAIGSMEIQLCPDEAGKVPASFSVDWEITLTENGVGYTVHENLFGTSVGSVNDNADLASIATDISSLLNFHTVGADSQTTTSVQVGLTYGSSENDANGLPSDLQIEVKNTNSTDPQIDLHKDVINAALFGVVFTRDLVQKVYKDASQQWQDGYCLEVTFDGLDSAAGDQEVYPGTTTPFTAKVHHKFEGNDLELPLQGTLNGQQSLDPSGNNQAPVQYTYQAPGAGNQLASIQFETRSRRGVAKNHVVFKVLEYAVTLNGTITNAYSNTWSDGAVCSGSITFNFSLKLYVEVDASGNGYFDAKKPVASWSGSATCPLCSYSGDGSGEDVWVQGIVKDGMLELQMIEMYTAVPAEDGACNLFTVDSVNASDGDPLIRMELKDGSTFHLTFDASDRYAYPTQQTIDLSLQVGPEK